MPKVIIKEVDNTNATISEPNDNIVLMFVRDESGLTPVETECYERLGDLGAKIILAKYEGDISVKEFSDKGKYNLRFICFPEAKMITTPGSTDVDVTEFDKIIEIASNRGDSIALVDIPAEEKDTIGMQSFVNSLCLGDKEFVIREDGTKENRLAYASAFTPRIRFKGLAKDLWLPASFGYLSCFFSHVKDYESWFPFAGSIRGVLPFTDVETEIELGDADIDILQPRKTGSESGDKPRAINVICNIRPFGNIVWGNRTLAPIEKYIDKYGDERDGLKASHFLNIRNLCCDIKKVAYRASRALTFEPNSDVLWVNFKSKITPTLEKMKTNQGCKGYKIIKEENQAKAELRARFQIIPIEGVEDFYLTVELTDSVTNE